MEVLEAILKRRSIRSFKPKPVERDKEELLLKAATLAPSAGNLQSRFFYFVRDKPLIEALRKAALGQDCLDAPLLIVACADLRAAADYGQRGRELYSTQDVSTSVENILLAATSLGLGTCWVGAFDEDAVRSVLKIPRHLRPEALIPVGYPDEHPVPKKLKPLEELARFV